MKRITKCRYWRDVSVSVLALLLATVLCVSPALAAPPSVPYVFQGDVTIGGSPAAEGKSVIAQIGGVTYASATVNSSHRYALWISPDNPETTPTKEGWAYNDVVQFLVDGNAAQTYTCTFGDPVELALSVGGGGGVPLAPILSSPINSATGVSTTPTLQWNASAGAISYRAQVSTSIGFTTTVFDQSSIISTQVVVSPALGASTTYHWRVNATNASGTSGWSAWSFTTVSGGSAPSAPNLSSPSNSATGVSTTPALQWNASTGATSYRAQVSTSSGFTTTVFDQSSIISTQVAVSPALNTSTTYHWRVNATNASGTSGWSSTWSFTTASGGGSPPPLSHYLYGTAYLNSSPVVTGTVIALINGSEVGRATTNASGQYGYSTLFSVPGSTGATITFTINGQAASQTVTWMSGGVNLNNGQPLNLYATTGGPLAVTTGSGTYVSPTTATLSGTLVSLGSDSSATPSIDYGPTTAYEWGTLTMSSMSSYGTFTTPAIGTGPSSPPAGGLTPGQVVHFKAKAVGSPSGTTVPGSDATYTHTPPGSLTITTPSLASGTVGSTYSATVAASGGTLPYSWSIVAGSGSLPTNLNLDPSTGVISGMPTTVQIASFTVRVTDAVSATNDKPLSITISTTPTPGDQLIGANDAPVIGSYSANYLHLFRWPALQSGNVVTMKVRARANGNIMVAIYSDDNAKPAALLASTTSTVLTTGSNSISIDSTPVIAGQYYWLAFNSSARVVGFTTTQRVTEMHKAIAYTGFSFPSPPLLDFKGGPGYAAALVAGY